MKRDCASIKHGTFASHGENMDYNDCVASQNKTLQENARKAKIYSEKQEAATQAVQAHEYQAMRNKYSDNSTQEAELERRKESLEKKREKEELANVQWKGTMAALGLDGFGSMFRRNPKKEGVETIEPIEIEKEKSLPGEFYAGFKGYIYINQSTDDYIMFGFDINKVKDSTRFTIEDGKIFDALIRHYGKGNVLPVKNIVINSQYLDNATNRNTKYAEKVTINDKETIIYKIAIPKIKIISADAGIDEYSDQVEEIIKPPKQSTSWYQKLRLFSKKGENEDNSGGKRKIKKSKKTKPKKSKKSKKPKKATRKAKK